MCPFKIISEINKNKLTKIVKTNIIMKQFIVKKKNKLILSIDDIIMCLP